MKHSLIFLTSCFLFGLLLVACNQDDPIPLSSVTPFADATSTSLVTQAVCPTPLYPSAAKPPAIPSYPQAQELTVEDIDISQGNLGGAVAEFEGQGPVHLTRTTSFMVVDTPDAVRLFYEDRLAKAGWQRQDITSMQNATYFVWIVDTKVWETPPCNATPETGLPHFILKLTTEVIGSSETRVRLDEGIVAGF